MFDAPAAISGRRADIDSLRVLALALLIVYHVLLIYTGREFWRENSSYHGYWADYLLATITPWRMALVFLIGGVAVRFMFSRPSFSAFLRERAARLLTAFLFAVVVLVPPQRFVQLDEIPGHPHTGYFSYLFGEAPFAVSYLGLHLPQFAHAWFLPYLFAYSCLAGALWWLSRRAFHLLQGAIERVPAPAWILATMGWFAFIETAFSVSMSGDRMFLTDWGGHLKFLPLFLLGVMIGRNARLLDFGRFKLRLWGAAAALLCASVWLEWLVLNGRPELNNIWLVARGAYGGAMLWSVVTFGHWALNRASPTLTYASDAILPVYLLHQTTLILAADVILGWRWPLALELPTLIMAATVVPLLIYHLLVRRTPWLRFLFGLRPRPRARTADAARPPVDYAPAHRPG